MFRPITIVQTALTLICLGVSIISTQVSALTLEQVYDAESVICGVTTGEPGFSAPNTKNEWIGIETELCRAIALAIFGTDSDSAVQFVPLVATERLEAVGSGRVHVLAAKTHWDMTKSLDYGVTMVGPYFYDGQGFLVRRSKNIRSAWSLQDVVTCGVAGGNEELQLRRFLKQLQSYISVSLYDNINSTILPFDEGVCDVISTDITELNRIRRRLTRPDEAVILPQLISQKPIGMIVPAQDAEWPQLVQLIFSAIVRAEELSLTSFNIEKAQEIGSDLQKEFITFGENEKFEVLSSDNWILEVITRYGNYGEMYKRNLGEGSVADFPLGLNKSWYTGGLLIQDPLF